MVPPLKIEIDALSDKLVWIMSEDARRMTGPLLGQVLSGGILVGLAGGHL